MHAHCHAPTCKRVELWNNDTGKLLCRQDPICERQKNPAYLSRSCYSSSLLV
jgi:hypothetical protein